MTLLIAQMKSPRIGRDQLIKDHTMRLGLKAVQWVFQRGIAAWIVKMSRTRHQGWRLRLETPRCINAIMLHPLVLRVGEHNMGRVRGVKRMGRVRGVERMGRVRRVERMERVRGVEEAIGEIR